MNTTTIKSTCVKLAAIAAICTAAAMPSLAYNHAHRWSFNGDYSDSVGNLTAVGTSSLTGTVRRR